MSCHAPYPLLSWLFACAKAQKIVPVDDHLMKVDPDQENHEEGEGGGEENVKRGGGDAIRESGGSDEEEDEKEMETPEKPFRPHFDLEVCSHLVLAPPPGM